MFSQYRMVNLFRNKLIRKQYVNCVRNFCSKKNIVWEKRIFSGIQPSGTLHVGNYFGAVENWVTLQNENNFVIYSIADLHAMTLPWVPEDLRSNILTLTASLIACGIDPSKSLLFQQSMVHQHSQLCWVLGCLSTMARLAHLPQYKEKKASLKDVPLGLFSYPVLQAADILLYRSTHVPVGEDQAQHLQLAQELARMVNNRFGVTFPSPKAIISGNDSSRIRSLREPNRKMSKSHADKRSRIELTDTPEEIVDKIKKAVTDFTSAVTFEPEVRPGVANLITLHSLAAKKSCEEICSENTHLDTGRYKLLVADALIARLTPIREEITRLNEAPDYLQDVLQRGAEKVSEIAESTWQDVKERMGIDIYKFKQKVDRKVAV